LINAEQHILEGDRRDFDNCTREQFIQKVRTALVELEAPEAEITAKLEGIDLDGYFSEKVQYNLSGNTLTIIHNESWSETFSRK
jgi:hypothetical protein